MLIFDLETNGLLPDVSKLHCINLIDVETGKEERYTDHECYQDLDGSYTDVPCPRTGDAAAGLERLRKAKAICGHNGIGYDVPVLRHLFPGWEPRGVVHDSQVSARLIWTNIKEVDFARLRKRKLPQEFLQRGLPGKHSLESWGYRLGDYKGDFKPDTYGHTWDTMPFTQDMDEYCMQDVRVTAKLWQVIQDKDYSPEALELERRVAEIISWQERTGWHFDIEGAHVLVAKLLGRKAQLETELRGTFGSFYVRNGKPFFPKRDNAKLGYVTGAPMSKVKLVEFNAGSRQHIASRLIHARGWMPTEFTPKGEVKVDETVLGNLPWPEAKVLSEYLLVTKRLGQIAEGKEAWLNHVRPTSRIHGRVNTNGAVTGRMTHFGPNVAQVPNNGAEYGKECRGLWQAAPGKTLVGCDADGLELRALAHRMAPFDGGDYVKTVLEGRKEDGTDSHSRNRDAIGLNKRDSAKTWFYAFIYGAGDYKLGCITFEDFTEEQRQAFLAAHPSDDARKGALTKLGQRSRAKLMKNLPALNKLIKKVKKVAAKRGSIRGLDGRLIHVRAQHSALNSLLQGDGAVVMKKALVLAVDSLFAEPSTRGKFAPVGNIHDEVQMEVEPDVATTVGVTAAEAIRLAGEHFGFRCPLAGNYDIGRSWAETH